jgi:hypothetical protein
MKPPNLLILTNEKCYGEAKGQVDGFNVLSSLGEVGEVNTVSHSLENSDNFLNVLTAIKSIKFDILIIWTPGRFPATEIEFEILSKAIGNRPVVYWEGDPWGLKKGHGLKGKKKPTHQMERWLKISEYVFTVSGYPQTDQFLELGARKVFHTLHTYCHIKFQKEADSPPDQRYIYDVSMMSRNLSRVPLLTGVPGSARRFYLASRVRKIRNIDFRLFGSQWPSGWSNGLLPYDLVVSEMRKSRLNINWDNFDYYHDYASDRLPMAMISGRVSLSTLHQGMEWAPREDKGVFLYSTVNELVDGMLEILSRNDQETHRLGIAGQVWAHNRISHKEAARYMISIVAGIAPPPSDPWGSLPGPYSRL